MNNPLSTILGALFIGLGIAAAGFFVSQTTLNERTGANTARVKGLSERIVPADTATWSLSSTITSRDYGNVATTFARAENNTKRIRETLTSAGFTDNEIHFAPLRKRDHSNRNRDGEVIDQWYSIGGDIFISTSEPAKIEPARQPVFALSKESIDVEEYNIDYRFTKLNEIKPDMLREATENARLAANEFAQNAGVEVGGIQNASQGGFQVVEANSGDANARAVNKLVRVVTTITFYLEN